MRILLAAALIVGFATPALSQARPPAFTPPPVYVAPRALNDQQLLHVYRQKLKPLREEILARKIAEGGNLSAASRAEFQERLDRLNADFRRFVSKQDIRGVNGWGYQQG